VMTISRRQSFDGQNSLAIALCRENRTRLHRVSVQMHRAGTALTRIAAHVGAREIELLSQDVNQGRIRSASDRSISTVHVEVYFHFNSPLVIARRALEVQCLAN
jgi:hypothetical protein